MEYHTVCFLLSYIIAKSLYQYSTNFKICNIYQLITYLCTIRATCEIHILALKRVEKEEGEGKRIANLHFEVCAKLGEFL